MTERTQRRQTFMPCDEPWLAMMTTKQHLPSECQAWWRRLAGEEEVGDRIAVDSEPALMSFPAHKIDCGLEESEVTRVSLVIPVRDEADTIEHLIQSVRRQSR